MSGVAAPEERETLRPGDQVTALLTLTQGKQAKQWVLELTADELTQEERERPPEAMTLFTRSGHQFSYGGGRAALKIRILGPVDGAGRKARAPAVQMRRITVSADYLALGLDQMAAMNARWDGLLKQDPKLKVANNAIIGAPYPAQELAAEKASSKAGLIELTETEEHAMGGAMLALREFFTTAQRTPGLREVLMSVLDVSWWSIMRSGGTPTVSFNNLPIMLESPAAEWGLPAGEKVGVVWYAMEIDDKQALMVVLAVTAPRPPLMAGAGIVGFVARAPNGKGSVLTMRILSSRAKATAP